VLAHQPALLYRISAISRGFWWMDQSRDEEASDFNMAETAISQIRGIFSLFEGGIYELAEAGRMDFATLCRQMNIVSGPDEFLRPLNVGLLIFNEHSDRFLLGLYGSGFSHGVAAVLLQGSHVLRFNLFGGCRSKLGTSGNPRNGHCLSDLCAEPLELRIVDKAVERRPH